MDISGHPTGYGCFYECVQLDNYEEIPDYWKTPPIPV